MNIASKSVASKVTVDTVEERVVVCRVALIGSTGRREFRGLVKWMCEHTQIRITHEYPDIEAALAVPDSFTDTQMTVVLQSFSDQYSAGAADQLIGRTLFQRMLCCFGAWCESDGRNRSIWPDAVRVPVRLAQSVIELELPGVGAEVDPIPPTAARDEIFAHRLLSESDLAIQNPENFNVAVVGSDRILRKTIIGTLRDIGLRTIGMPLITLSPRDTVRPQETSRGPIHVVLHDLDPWCPIVRDSLNAARQMFPTAKTLGLATVPDGGLTAQIADEHFDGVVPKLDMQHGLRWHLMSQLSAHNE